MTVLFHYNFTQSVYVKYVKAYCVMFFEGLGVVNVGFSEVKTVVE